MIKPKIIVDIGTDNQKKNIFEEIQNFINSIDRIFKVWFDAIIIPENFEETIRNITNDETYSTVRGRISVQAKFVQSEYGNTLALNPILFTQGYDTQVRFHLYLHETNHFINSLNKINFAHLSEVDEAYMKNISLLYEEYCSERMAWSICNGWFKEKTLIYREYISYCIQGHLDLISTTPQSLDNLKKVISDFRHHRSGDRFIIEVSPIVEPIWISFFYIIAIQKAAPKSVNKSLQNFPFPFNQTPSIEMASLCHDSFPEPLDYENVLEKTKIFFSQFGYELRRNPLGFVYVNIIGE